MKLILIALLFSMKSFAFSSSNKSCTFSLDTTSTEASWKAFKTTAKVGVKGVFDQWTVTGEKKALALDKLLSGLKFEIDSHSIKTGNPGRDINIATNFFKKMAGKITGSAKNIKLINDESGTLDLHVTMNGKTQKVPMTFSFDAPSSEFNANGSLDILSFGAKAAFDSLHKSCFELHKGKDGVSKTWSDVEVHLKSKISKSCS